VTLAGDRSVAELFGDNMERLKKLKTKYDPKNLFNKMHPINTTPNVAA
jgi:FAD/FMN-containing dehydrogenase